MAFRALGGAGLCVRQPLQHCGHGQGLLQKPGGALQPGAVPGAVHRRYDHRFGGGRGREHLLHRADCAQHCGHVQGGQNPGHFGRHRPVWGHLRAGVRHGGPGGHRPLRAAHRADCGHHRQRFVYRPAALPLKARAQGHPPGCSPQRRLRLCRLPRGRGERPMRSAAYRANLLKLGVMALLVLAACAAYLLVDVNPKYFDYAMSLRVPKLIVMLIAAFAIGGASLVFQSVINNTIVTPCLLGMNSLYTLIHTAVVFVAGSGSILAVNANAAFAVDLVIMGLSATVIYGYLFKKTKYNVLYVLLIGTVLTSFFGSIQSTLTRVMDPNEYDSLLSTLVASFSNVNAEIILFSLVVLALLVFFLRRDLALLDVLTLGKEQAINLGVDYDRSVRRLLLGVTLAIAVATAVVGPISFMGLIIANLSRQLLKTYRHTQLIAGSVLFGMVILVAGQLIVEHVYTYSIPISVFITVGGGVYFLYLLLTRRRV